MNSESAWNAGCAGLTNEVDISAVPSLEGGLNVDREAGGAGVAAGVVVVDNAGANLKESAKSTRFGVSSGVILLVSFVEVRGKEDAADVVVKGPTPLLESAVPGDGPAVVEAVVVVVVVVVMPKGPVLGLRPNGEAAGNAAVLGCNRHNAEGGNPGEGVGRVGTGANWVSFDAEASAELVVGASLIASRIFLATEDEGGATEVMGVPAAADEEGGISFLAEEVEVPHAAFCNRRLSIKERV